MVQPELGDAGTELQVIILGDTYAATVIGESPFDPDNFQLRS